MGLTLNQVIKRVETLALSHKMINHFFIGGIDEFLDDKDVQYPAIFCEIKPGNNSRTERVHTYNFTFYFLDLLNISSEALQNEWEVKSDMDSVAQDFLAMLSYSEYQDTWDITPSRSLEYHSFKLHDLCAGVSCSIGISVRFDSNRCQVPATGVTFEVNQSDMIVQNYIYTGQGTEGNTLTVGTLANKKILILYKGDKLLVPVSGTLTTNDFTYTVATGLFTFGTDIEQDQIIQILWRNL
jgi:hypothetical protein